jgi:ABC-type antimicrobial peptide transport system permease subunit
LFGKGNPIGRRIRDDKQSYEVVGVVHDLNNGMGVKQSIIYLPLTRRNFARPPADGMTIMVRSDAGGDALSAIRREIAAIDPNLTIFNARTLNDYLELSRASERFAVDTYGGIGLFGLVLAAIGLAGVTAYAVAQRRKEIGIRMALGARKNQVLLLVLREGAALVGVGTALGFLGAFVAAKLLSTLTNIFADSLKVGTDDPRLLLGAPLLLAGLAMVACYLPARKAAKIDPLRAVREE